MKKLTRDLIAAHIYVFLLVVVAVPHIADGAQRGNARVFNYCNVYWQVFKLSVESGKLKLGALPHNVVVATFMPKTYESKSGSAFAMRAAYPNALAMAKEKLANWNTKTPFIIRTTIRLGEYDFKTQVFPLKPFKRSTYFPIEGQYDSTCTKAFTQQMFARPWPEFQYDVLIDNPGVVNGLPMPERSAAKFINARTEGGAVNRKVYADISVTINALAHRANYRNSQFLIGHIRRVKVYADSRETILLRTYKP